MGEVRGARCSYGGGHVTFSAGIWIFKRRRGLQETGMFGGSRENIIGLWDTGARVNIMGLAECAVLVWRMHGDAGALQGR